MAEIIMSSVEEAGDDICCANCGIAEVDDIKLEDCDGCDLVKYCGDKCRGEHRENHEEVCEKRKAELHDNDLFSQPERSHLGECPLCFLPLPLVQNKSTFKSCCSKVICNGCVYAHRRSSGGDRCPFCREPTAKKENIERRLMKRVKANDPAAMRRLGTRRYNEGDDSAFEYYIKAAELGDVHAHCQLGVMYRKGEGVKRDEEKAVYHSEQAAIGGHNQARHNLGCYEGRNGNMERAVKHFIINANLGDEDSMKALWWHYSEGNITKEDLDATLRTHQAAIVETKSPEREAAEMAWS